MGIREKVNSSSVVGYCLIAALFLFTVGMLTYNLKPDKRPNPTGEFYTDDDGKTYFSDTIYKFPPFDHDGKTAVMAFVYHASSGNFVGYMARYTPEARKQLQDAYAKVQAGQAELYTVSKLLASRELLYSGMQVKMPGGQWVSRGEMPHPPVKAPDGGDCSIVLP